MRETSCAIIGHRLLPRNKTDEIIQNLAGRILQLARLGITRFLTGGGIGFETLAAKTVLKCREENPDISLSLVLPGRDQAAKWPQDMVQVYENIKSQSDEIIYTSERVGYGSLLRRNHYMLDEADYLLCYATKATGRTVDMMHYAQRTNHTVINIAEAGSAGRAGSARGQSLPRRETGF